MIKVRNSGVTDKAKFESYEWQKPDDQHETWKGLVKSTMF